MNEREAFEKWYLSEYGMNPNAIGLNHDERKHASASKNSWQAQQVKIDKLREAIEEVCYNRGEIEHLKQALKDTE